MDRKAAQDFDRQIAGILAFGFVAGLFAVAGVVWVMHLLIKWLAR